LFAESKKDDRSLIRKEEKSLIDIFPKSDNYHITIISTVCWTNHNDFTNENHKKITKSRAWNILQDAGIETQ